MAANQSNGLASNLEQNLQSVVDKTMSASNDVKGIVCCNEEGYLYCSNGTMNDDSADDKFERSKIFLNVQKTKNDLAIIAHLSTLVGQLENDDPVIQLESKNSRILIHKRGEVIVGIHKAISEPQAGT